MAPFNYPFNFSFGRGRGQGNGPGQFPQYPFQFDSQDQEQQNPYQMQQPAPAPNFADAYREAMSRPPGKAMQAYEDFLSHGYPVEGKASKTTRIGALLSGAAQAFSHNPGASYDTARSVIHEPYDREVRRYQLEGNRLNQAANLEETQRSKNLEVIKAFDEAENRRTDNARAQAQLNETIRNNNSLIAQREASARNAGLALFTGSNGHRYSQDKSSGKTTDLGKYEQSAEEKSKAATDQAVATAKGTRPIIEGSQKRLEGIRFGHAKELQEDRQAATDEQRKKRSEDTAKRDASKLGVKSPSEIEKLRKNHAVVESIVDTDKARYSKVWGTDSSGNSGLIDKIPPIGSEEYKDYVELYNALHKGVVLPNGKPAQLNPNITPGGNERIPR